MMDLINNKSLDIFGAFLAAESYSALMTPPPLKASVENNDRSKNGTEVLIRKDQEGNPAPLIAERDVTLQFVIFCKTSSEYLSCYNAFIAELHKGEVVLEISDLGRKFFLIYANTTQFGNYSLNACTLSVKFREPDPTKRQ